MEDFDPVARARLLDSGEHVAGLGSWEWLPGPDLLRWSDNLYRIFDLRPQEITPTRVFIQEQIHPDDRERVARHIELSRDAAAAPPIEYRITTAHRGVRYLRSTITAIESAGRGTKRIVGTVLDVTDHRLAGRELAAHIAVSGELAAWQGLQPSGSRLLQRLAEAMECAFAALWLPCGDVLTARLCWSDPDLGTSAFEAATRALRLRRGVGAPGIAWEHQAPLNIADMVMDPSFRRPRPAAADGLHGAMVFPAVHAGEVLAVVELCSCDELRPTARLSQTLGAIGYELGAFLSHHRAQLRPPWLTPREMQILRLVADGFSGPQIADQLEISVATVGTHMKHIYQRLGVSDRAAAVAVGIRSGLIE
jgi:DNA-binding CsgD family transcriptional regulator